MNKVFLSGNATDIAKPFNLSDDRLLLSFTVATSQSYLDKKGDKQTITQFHNCLNYKPSNIKYIKSVLKKGSLVIIEGSIQYTTTEKDGTKYHNTNIVVDDIKIYNFDRI